MIELIATELVLLFVVIIALVVVLDPKKKVCDKFDMDFSEQDKINKENI